MDAIELVRKFTMRRCTRRCLCSYVILFTYV